MEFEEILEDVGGFGTYQKILLFVFMFPSFIIIAWFTVGLIFISSTPEHWCYVPEVSNSNLSIDIQKQLIRPPSDLSCSMYDINYTYILNSGNWTTNSEWPIKPCEYGWHYDTMDYDATAVTRWNMVCENSHYSSLVLSLLFLGNCIGTPIYACMVDRLGRKKTFFILAVIYGITEISSVFSPHFTLFLILRTVNGTVIATIYTVGYLIVIELVSPNVRAKVNMLATTFWTFGLCLLPLVAWLTRNWIYLSGIITTCAAGLLLYWKLLLESPSWLISEDRYDEALVILTKISKINGKNIHEENLLCQKILKLSENSKRESDEKHTLLDFFKYPFLTKKLLLITVCWIGDLIPYYGLYVNVKNLAGSEFLNFFLVSVVEVPALLITWLFIENIGRRWCSVFAFLIISVSCLIPAFCSKEYEMVGITASLLAKFGASAAFMSLFQQSSELFPTSFRGIGMGISRAIGMGSTLLVPYIVYLGKYGNFIPFLIFCLTAFAGAVCASFLPETLNRKLPQTVEDAENIARDFEFFSFSQQCTADLNHGKAKNWTPSTLSASDLSSSNRNFLVNEPSNKFPVVLIKSSILC